ncbi:PREDICTED: disease resistance protein RPP8-like [Ipomoea nil]|uniref:disease resistance protein RPP8-like n=1 Tax=Ipomoea nil TaxID=35883 RepID=UPI0009016FC5|nr:PREDICTED: disease resistance protein RPP8-like [Ipomoea nil]
MAGLVDPVAGRLLDRLVHVVDENKSLLEEIKNQVDGLLVEMENLIAHLDPASRNRRELVDQISDVVMEAEDAIRKYAVEKKNHKDKGLLRYLEMSDYSSRISDSVKEIKAIRYKVREIWESNAAALQALIDHHGQPQPAIHVMAPVMMEEVDAVGIDSEAKLIKDRLIKGPAHLRVISIERMAGIGKTTLSKVIFDDYEIQYEFFTCLWVCVSKMMNLKQIFLDILSNFTKNTKEFQGMLEEKLADKIKEYLENGKYFIVVDDVCTERDWDCLQIAFPNNNKGSRVLLTTRVHDVASHASSTGNPTS